MSVSPKSRGTYPGTAQAVASHPSTTSFQQPPSYASILNPPIGDHEGMDNASICTVDFLPYQTGQDRFWRQTPPPTYSESQLNCDIQRSINSVYLPVIWSREPKIATCPACGRRAVTVTHKSISKNTHIAALTLCMLGCWPCCLIPYLPMCQIVNHYCRRCQYLIGVYDPWDYKV